MKWIEDIGKDVMNYSRVGKLIHFLKNRNNRHAVFIWIPKNAGTSIYRTLRRYGCLKAKKIPRVKYRFSQRGLVTFGHMDYARLVSEGYVSPSYDRKAFKFCFTRNPYDRAISLYEYFKTSFPETISFAEFIKYITEQELIPIGLFNSRGLSSCNPQVRWIENIDIDYCGKFESLQQDFNNVLSELRLPKTGLKHLNKSVRTRMQKYYDLETKKRVENFYKEDFERFSYGLEPDDSVVQQNQQT
jgi:hypothetical protein